MADLPTDDYKFQTYLDSNDNNSEFEGISEQESDVDIPNILESSDDEGENESNDEEIDDEIELSANFHIVKMKIDSILQRRYWTSISRWI